MSDQRVGGNFEPFSMRLRVYAQQESVTSLPARIRDTKAIYQRLLHSQWQESYWVNSLRKCLASFSMRFSFSARSLGSCPRATWARSEGTPAESCANSSASCLSFAAL